MATIWKSNFGNKVLENRSQLAELRTAYITQCEILLSSQTILKMVKQLFRGLIRYWSEVL
jgi:hypothetical protein